MIRRVWLEVNVSGISKEALDRFLDMIRIWRECMGVEPT